jgi:diacylglycerol kinase family enzyme
MTGRVVFFSNPQSQAVQQKGSRLKTVYTARRQDSDIYQDRDIYLEAQSPEQTQSDFTALALTPEDHLFIEGGDGTMQCTLSSLLNSLNSPDDCPKLSIIAGGLTNQIAANIGLKTAHDKHIKAAIHAAETGLCPTPILRIQQRDHAPVFGCLFSTGALPFVTEYYESKVRSSQSGSKIAIAGTLVKAVSGNKAARDELMPATELSLTIEMMSQTRSKTGPHLGTVVTTLPSLMMGLDPFWGDGTGDIRLLYANGRARRLVRNLAGLWLGRKTIDRSGDGLESYRANKLSFHYDGPIVLDGEAFDMSGAPFTLSATPPLPFVTTPKS